MRTLVGLVLLYLPGQLALYGLTPDFSRQFPKELLVLSEGVLGWASSVSWWQLIEMAISEAE